MMEINRPCGLGHANGETGAGLSFITEAGTTFVTVGTVNRVAFETVGTASVTMTGTGAGSLSDKTGSLIGVSSENGVSFKV